MVVNRADYAIGRTNNPFVNVIEAVGITVIKDIVVIPKILSVQVIGERANLFGRIGVEDVAPTQPAHKARTAEIECRDENQSYKEKKY